MKNHVRLTFVIFLDLLYYIFFLYLDNFNDFLLYKLIVFEKIKFIK